MAWSHSQCHGNHAHQQHQGHSHLNIDQLADELAGDLDVSLSGLGCDSANASLLRDMNQAISSLSVVKEKELLQHHYLNQQHVRPENMNVHDNVKSDFDESNNSSPPKSQKSLSSDDSNDGSKDVLVGFDDERGDSQYRPRLLTVDERTAIKKLCFAGLRISSSDSMNSSNQSTYQSEPTESPLPLTSSSLPTDSIKQEPVWHQIPESSAPSVCDIGMSEGSVQPGQTMRQTFQSGFQYILGAPTALGISLSEESMTYLNQGQSYEVRLKRIGDNSVKGNMLRSIVRLGFEEKRLQYRESEEVANWGKLRPKDRILDVDLSLSYGVFDVLCDSFAINTIQFMWDPSRESSIFIKINCISTEFTSKRHGGERGAPLRLFIDTFALDNGSARKLDSAACQLKVFKSKGADRKHKTDRDRLGKTMDDDKYQPSYQCTLLTPFQTQDSTCSSEQHVPSTTSSNKKAMSSCKPIQSSTASSSSTSTSNMNTNDTSTDTPERVLKDENKHDDGSALVLPTSLSPSDTNEWLKQNRFSKLSSILSDFSSDDLRRLSRDDLIEMCGLSDGIRLFNTLHIHSLRPRLTLFVSTGEQVFQAIYLQSLTANELRVKLLDDLLTHCSPSPSHITSRDDISMFMFGPSGIKIRVSDSVVENIKNESVFKCVFNKDPVPSQVSQSDQKCVHESNKYSIVLHPLV